MALTLGKDLFGAANDLIGGVGDYVATKASAKGDKISAAGSLAAAGFYGQASDLATQNAGLAAASSAIQQTQADRQVYLGIGGQKADVAGAGFTAGGSALDLLRSSQQQGALQRQLLNTQGLINQQSFEQEAIGYQAQKAAAESQAAASETAAKGKKKGGLLGAIGTGLKVAGTVASIAGLFSDEETKQDITPLGPSHIPGVGLYLFRYKGSSDIFRGVIAQEVAEYAPHAVAVDEATGFYKVDYAALGLTMEKVG